MSKGVTSSSGCSSCIGGEDLHEGAKTWIGETTLGVGVLKYEFSSIGITGHGTKIFGEFIVEEFGHPKDLLERGFVMGDNEPSRIGDGGGLVELSPINICGTSNSSILKDDEPNHPCCLELPFPDSMKALLLNVEIEGNDLSGDLCADF